MFNVRDTVLPLLSSMRATSMIVGIKCIDVMIISMIKIIVIRSQRTIAIGTYTLSEE